MDGTSIVHCNKPSSKSKLKSSNRQRRLTRRNGDHHHHHHHHHHNNNSVCNYRNRYFSARKNPTRFNGKIRNVVGEFCELASEPKNKRRKFSDLDDKHEDETAKVHAEDLVVGKFTREVYNAICLRLEDTTHIPEDSVKALFNDMHLFVSDTQVTKMLQCARQYSRRNGTHPNFLSFGEFCVFVSEMQNHSSPKTHRKASQSKLTTNKCLNNKCEVFLGGSCNPTTWRADTAIPALQKQGISFYNPQVSRWAPELLDQEHDAKQSASVLLFVIDSQTRSTVGMLEVAYLVACGRCVIVVAQPYRMGQTIMGEVITEREYNDLVQGQQSLLELIKSKGVQVHNNLSTALECTANILKNVSVNGTSPEDQVIYKLRRLREVYDSYNGQMRIYDLIKVYPQVTNRDLNIAKLSNYLTGDNSTANGTLSFEKFCAVMAELSTDSCGMCKIEATTQNYFNCAVDATQATLSHSVNDKPPYDVYLGGSLTTETNWRESIAVPLLEQKGFKYYNPAIRDQKNSSDSQDELLRWRHEIDRCRIVLFVITNDTRSLTSMILAAHYIGVGKEVVLSIEQLPSESCVIANETLTETAVKDYNRARAYLKDLAERRQISVFDNADQAVACVVSKLAKIAEATPLTR